MGQRRTTRMVIKIQFSGTSVPKHFCSSSAFLALSLGKRLPTEPPAAAPSLPLRLIAPISTTAATLRALLSTHRTDRRPGGDSAEGGGWIKWIDFSGEGEKLWCWNRTNRTEKKPKQVAGDAAGRTKNPPPQISKRTLLAPWAIPESTS